MTPLGKTRTTVQRNHAFIAPDGYVRADLLGWSNTQGIILISPQLQDKARFTQYIAEMLPEAVSGLPLSGVQRFVYVLGGNVTLNIENTSKSLIKGDYAYIPADTPHTLTAQSAARLLIFEKPYTTPHIETDDTVTMHSGDAWAGNGEPFMGDEDARLRVLLPTSPAYDMAVNLFTFRSGAALPYVETHIMEHGLYLLEGQGVYRLDESWYPIQAGDALWMGSYCPQWFCAFGKTRSTYIYYKDVNRDPLS